jgi:hypothetical protein
VTPRSEREPVEINSRFHVTHHCKHDPERPTAAGPAEAGPAAVRRLKTRPALAALSALADLRPESRPCPGEARPAKREDEKADAREEKERLQKGGGEPG